MKRSRSKQSQEKDASSGQSNNSSSKKRLIPIAIVLIAIIAVLLWPGVKPQRKTSKQPPDSGSNSLDPQKAGCDALLRRAAELILHGSSGYEPALDLLASCILKNKSHNVARWNMGAILLKMNRPDEALVHMKTASLLQPENVDYHHGTGILMVNLKHFQPAVNHLHHYIELTLGVESFPDLLSQVADANPEDLDFIAAEGDRMLSSLENLLRAYLRLGFLRNANYLYHVLVALNGESIELHARYHTFAFGIGDMERGIEYMKREMRLRFVEGGAGSMEEAFQVIEVHAARLFAAGFNAYVVSLAKNTLIGSQNEIGSLLLENCGVSINISETAVTVDQSDVRFLLAQCILKQHVLKSVLEVKGALHSENLYGWNAFLNAVALGDVNIIKIFLQFKADIQGRTLFGMTSLHVAASLGHSHLVQPLLQAGLSASILDYYNRSALDVACMHRWPFQRFAEALKIDPSLCNQRPAFDSSATAALSRGGWLEGDFELPETLTEERCDIDVRNSAELTPEILLRDYLAIQRPVLIRGGAAGWKTVRAAFQRRSLQALYGDLIFKRSMIPYAEVFGFSANFTTLKDFLNDLSQLYAARKSLNGSIQSFLSSTSELPPYIFERLNSNSPLRENFVIPDALDPEVTRITINSVQFYVGPSLSGAPVHFHGPAWNSLVYGKKRWFLYPPTRAVYSKRHVWGWYSGDDGKESGYQGDAMECVQHAGDVIFVPGMWGHGVINLQESVGFASEFVFGASEFSI